MSDEFALLISLGMFVLAQHEQDYHFQWSNDSDYAYPEIHRKLWIAWTLLGGLFCVISAYLLTEMFLKP